MAGSIILYSVMAGALTLVGIGLLKVWHQAALRYSHYINSFAAGLILTAALSALLPRALHENENAGAYALGGFVAFLVLETFLVLHSGAEVHYPRGMKSRAQGMTFFWGLFVHSFLDGLIIAMGFATGPDVGLLTSLAVISHELPEGITTFSLLLQSMKHRQAIVLAIAVALATPVGALVGLGVLPAMRPGLMGAAMGAVAGSFLYIAATDIVPEIREEHAGRNVVCLVLGAVFLLTVHHFLPH